MKITFDSNISIRRKKAGDLNHTSSKYSKVSHTNHNIAIYNKNYSNHNYEDSDDDEKDIERERERGKD